MPRRRSGFRKQPHTQRRSVNQTDAMFHSKRRKIILQVLVQQVVPAVRQDAIYGRFRRNLLQHFQSKPGDSDKTSFAAPLDITQSRQGFVYDLASVSELN